MDGQQLGSRLHPGKNILLTHGQQLGRHLQIRFGGQLQPGQNIKKNNRELGNILRVHISHEVLLSAFNSQVDVNLNLLGVNSHLL